MIQTLTSSDFIHAFHAYKRYEQFGYEALNLLFEHFEDCDPNMELDVISICCDYSHDSADGIAGLYDIDISDCDDDEKADTVRDWLSEHTTLVGETSTGFVYVSSF